MNFNVAKSIDALFDFDRFPKFVMFSLSIIVKLHVEDMGYSGGCWEDV